MKIVEYKTINDNDLLEFLGYIDNHILNGRQPLGGVAIDVHMGYAQAMVKYEDKQQSLDNKEEIHIKTGTGSGYTRDKDGYGVFYD